MDGKLNKVLLSVVSFCDTELLPTIQDALSKAKHPENITFSIVEQDLISNYDQINNLIASYNSSLIYKYATVEESRGVVWARWWAAKPLHNNEYSFYLQIDSHSRFIEHYDSFLINSYLHAKDYWGEFVWTSYCPNYTIIDGVDVLTYSQPTATFAIVDNSLASKLVGCVKQFDYKNVYGQLSLQVSGHFLFGDSNIFIKHEFDTNLYWEGEESTYAARLYCDDIKTVSPPQTYLWHKYEPYQNLPLTRKRHSESEVWENQDFMNEKIKYLYERGIERCISFWDNNLVDEYPQVSKEKLDNFLYLEDRTPPKEYGRIGF